MIETLLSKMIKTGDLTAHLPGGRVIKAGDGSGPPVVIRINGRGLRRLANPSLGLGEGYMEGDIVFEQGSIDQLLTIVGESGGRTPKRGSALSRFRKALKRRVQQVNGRVASRRNVAHHYDLSNELYRRFLDADMQYSCAYFERPDMTLEEAQAAKKALIGRKLLIQPGMKTLDIGSGWGGLSMTLAKDFGARMTGVTLSTEQLALARERADKAGLSDRIDFRLTDYRDLDETFDRVVSVGMLEHVGAPNFRTYFETINRLLTDDGVALVHSIGKMHGPGATNAFTQKYIFPGGYIPGLSEIVAAIEQAGLWITDIEILRLHYAETCRIWRQRFMADPDIPTLFDARFRRMWEFYLAGAELGFRHGGHMVFQIQLAKRRDGTPLTRDYLLKGAAG
ncbi:MULTISPECIES: cyclopropane-fatty-acyl-phospholipid synthase family protein [Caulobacter]|jgi:cyclopropane-fatty-acyl-phospholipid synthase|uniref:Cyclopropane-fatty-acyl-phospholipid synthase n=2 Tax=Bacteria TaxID=2 RepID=R0E8Y2_CAUVI|nr:MULTISPECIES: cyclopropane-fatty-acyl-phospholipid synthase family protein [Caulobacter]ENZ78574.1 cyclopropane-fatty-acyl-phospholipid synthase [Caulobacter vibrioides OR37]MBQ1563474.1 class I SAM-dependent methyltransferase [Caulobacter sp.]